MMGKKSIRTDSRDGWLQVRVSRSGQMGEQIAIPEYLQVEHEGTKVNIPNTRRRAPGARVTGLVSGKSYLCAQMQPDQMYYFPSDREGQEREFCTILEGPHRGKKIAVLALKNGGRFHLLTAKPPVYFIFTLGSKIEEGYIYGTLQYGGPTDVVNAFTDKDNKVPAGEHVLQLPDMPHSGGGYYMGDCNSPKTWFRVGSSGDRYLHPGTASDGCVTILPGEWNQVFRRLETARKGDGINVGTIKVIHSR